MNEAKPEKSCNCLYFKLAFTSLGLVSGISIFFPFLFVYGNYNAALCGLASALFATIVLHLHILYIRNSLHKTYTSRTLRLMKLIGAVSSGIAIVAFICYIILAIVNKQGYKLYYDGYAPAAIFSLMTFKWTFALFWEGRRYQNILEKESLGVTSPLLQSVQIDPSLHLYSEQKAKPDANAYQNMNSDETLTKFP